jgi:hypothetical protein
VLEATAIGLGLLSAGIPFEDDEGTEFALAASFACSHGLVTDVLDTVEDGTATFIYELEAIIPSGPLLMVGVDIACT